MANYISKKSLSNLRIKIYDLLDQFFVKKENSYLDDNVLNSIKDIVDASIKSIQENNDDNSDILGDRQFRVLEYLKNFNEITRREYASMFGISFMTAFRDLTLLEKKKIVIKIGRGRATKYLIK